MKSLKERIQEAAQHFWDTRELQGIRQKEKGIGDVGTRGLVTGGKQIELFEAIAIDIITNAGIPRTSIFQSKALELPGYFRPEKKWDLLVIHNKTLVAALEFKSQIGPSFGNNFNNRTEEAIGTASDLWVAFREGAFGHYIRPWLGYFFLLEDCTRSTTPVKNAQPHFKVFPEFENASYAKRYEILLTKLVLERLYDSTGLVMLTQSKPTTLREPNPNLSGSKFFTELENHILGFVRTCEEG